MINFTGCTCDVCNEKFTTESDVVVCPECGTPHHRHCYNKLGHCVHEDKHSENFEWKAPEQNFHYNDNRCPRCQTQNPKDALFCENCGISLAPQAKQSHSEGPIPPNFEEFKQMHQKTSVVPPVLPKSLEGEFDGVSYKDMAIYIGESAPYYIYHFKNLAAKIKHFRPFCWSAFFFDGFYYLYRKMWLEALSILIISSIFAAPSMMVMFTDAGLISSDILASFGNIDTLIMLGSALTFAYKVFLGYWAIPRYQKKVCRDIKRLKAQSASNNDFYQTLVKKSGPSKAMLYAGIAFCIIYLFI